MNGQTVIRERIKKYFCDIIWMIVIAVQSQWRKDKSQFLCDEGYRVLQSWPSLKRKPTRGRHRDLFKRGSFMEGCHQCGVSWLWGVVIVECHRSGESSIARCHNRRVTVIAGCLYSTGVIVAICHLYAVASRASSRVVIFSGCHRCDVSPFLGVIVAGSNYFGVSFVFCGNFIFIIKCRYHVSLSQGAIVLCFHRL